MHVTVAGQACLKNKPENTLLIKNAHFKCRGTKGHLCSLALCIPPQRRLLCACARAHTRTHAYNMGFLALWLCEHTWLQGNSLRPAPYFRQTKQPIDSNGSKLLMTWAKNEEPLNLLKESVNVRGPTADLSPDLITATYDNRVGFIFMPGSRLQWSILQCWLFCIHTRNRSKLTECGFHGSLESSM